ncbi:MAG: TFIIB-type zinc ribbon-containing protein [Candidatus Bathyarchaeia archaeon]
MRTRPSNPDSAVNSTKAKGIQDPAYASNSAYHLKIWIPYKRNLKSTVSFSVAEVRYTLYCPECGGETFYDINTKHYSCKSCGLTLAYHELVEAKSKNLPGVDEEERRRQERRDYLKWWLSKKD